MCKGQTKSITVTLSGSTVNTQKPNKPTTNDDDKNDKEDDKTDTDVKEPEPDPLPGTPGDTDQPQN